MGVFERVLKAISDTIKLDEKVSQVSSHVKTLSQEVREMNNRLIRIETIIDITQQKNAIKKIDKK